MKRIDFMRTLAVSQALIGFMMLGEIHAAEVISAHGIAMNIMNGGLMLKGCLLKRGRKASSHGIKCVDVSVVFWNRQLITLPVVLKEPMEK